MNAAPNPMPFTAGTGSHPPGCWRDPGHHGCAIALLDALSRDTANVAWDVDECLPLADYIEWVAVNAVIPDLPQPSLPLPQPSLPLGVAR